MEADGVVPVAIDLETADLDEIPDEPRLRASTWRCPRTPTSPRPWPPTPRARRSSSRRSKGVKAFLHCSSCAVYEPNGHVRPRRELDPLGDNHRAMGFLDTYSISKIAAESAVKYAARRFEVPAVIARLDVPYGPTHGWPKIMLELAQMGMPTPVHPERAQHAQLPARRRHPHQPPVPARAGRRRRRRSSTGAARSWSASRSGPPSSPASPASTSRSHTTTASIPPNPTDPSKLLGLGWTPTVGWRDGFRRLVETSFPDLYKG